VVHGVIREQLRRDDCREHCHPDCEQYRDGTLTARENARRTVASVSMLRSYHLI
jgi:hypothetical protein